MKRKWFVSTLILGLFLSLSFVSSQQSHPAGEITPGSFQNGGDYIFPANSFIGIGKSSPGQPLHIKAYSDKNIRLEEDGAGVEYFDIGIDNNGNLEIWRDNGVIALSILDATGLVGIGLETPLELLDVSGAIRLGTTSNTNDGTIRWTGTDFEGRKSGSWVSLTTGGGGYWILSGTDLYPQVTGWNVGIGTDSPAKKLDVAGTFFAGGDAVGASYGVEIDGTSINAYCINRGAMCVYPFDLSINTPDSGNIILQESGNGRVGIGTSSPTTKLMVDEPTDNHAVISIDSGSTASRTSAVDFYDRGTNKWGIGKDNGNEFYIAEYDVANRLKIEPGGEVGIGTDNPDDKLEVSGVLQIDGNTAPNSGTQSNLRLGETSSYKWIQSFDSQPLAINPMGNNVGIGTNDPLAKLQVNGKMSVIYNSESEFKTGDSYIFLQPVANDRGRIGFYDISSGWMDLILQEGGGKVGIGINSPAETLDVAGNAYVQRLLVKTNTISSYSDISLSANAMIETDNNLYFSIDSDNNDDNTRSFIFGHDSDTTTGFDELMRIGEDGTVKIENHKFSPVSINSGGVSLAAGQVSYVSGLTLPAGRALKLWKLMSRASSSNIYAQIYSMTDGVVLDSRDVYGTTGTRFDEGSPLGSWSYTSNKQILFRLKFDSSAGAGATWLITIE